MLHCKTYKAIADCYLLIFSHTLTATLFSNNCVNLQSLKEGATFRNRKLFIPIGYF